MGRVDGGLRVRFHCVHKTAWRAAVWWRKGGSEMGRNTGADARTGSEDMRQDGACN